MSNSNEPNEPIRCPVCSDSGLVRKDGRETHPPASGMTIPELLQTWKPCLFCPAGEVSKPAYDAVADEWSKPIFHRDGRLMVPGHHKINHVHGN